MGGLFSSRERRALPLFLVLAGLLAVGVALLDRRTREVDALLATTEWEQPADSVERFPFDPNTVTYEELRRLGFTPRLAASLLKYRTAGKVFRIPEDLAACYGMTDSIYAALAPWIVIGEEYRFQPRTWNSGDTIRRAARPQRRITPREPFGIDTASAPYLASLGFSVRQAEAIIRYRDLCGIRCEEDLRACYLIADSVADSLVPYVIYPAEAMESTLVEINTADSAALLAVVGIGERSVGAILRYRERLGGFHSVEQLAEIPQVTEANFERILKQICCDSCKIQKININFAAPNALQGHPYLPPRVLRKLLSKRQLKGGWSTTEELIEDHILTREEATRLAPYLDFGVQNQL